MLVFRERGVVRERESTATGETEMVAVASPSCCSLLPSQSWRSRLGWFCGGGAHGGEGKRGLVVVVIVAAPAGKRERVVGVSIAVGEEEDGCRS